MGGITLPELLDRVEALRPTIEGHAEKAELNADLTPEVVQAARDAGLLGMLAPTVTGGLGADLLDACRAVEALAAIDGSVGWNISQSASFNALKLPLVGTELGDDAHGYVAGGTHPPLLAEVVDGGLRVSGRVVFLSGINHATWCFALAIVVADGVPVTDEAGMPDMRFCFVRAEDVEVIPTWDPVGMRGTGSNDGTFDGVFVPDQYALRPDQLGAEPVAGWEDPMYRIAPWPPNIFHAYTVLGIATGALDDVVEIVGAKTPNLSETPLRERGVIHQRIAEARSLLESAEAYLAASTTGLLQAADGDGIGDRERVSGQLSVANAGTAARRVIDLCAEVAATSTIKRGTALEKRMRDARTIANHAVMQPLRYESCGRVMVGLEPDFMLLQPF